MNLQDILYKINISATSGSTNLEIEAIHFDSRQIKPNCLFFATKGTQTDGHAYIQKAIENGAVAVICEDLPKNIQEGVTYIQTPDSSEALGVAAANFYENPSQKLKLVGVTGTNGKTTNVTLLYNLFRGLGYSAGMLSTVENYINDKIVPATHTTPDAIQLNALLAEMVKAGCQYCFMEASSHAVVQRRIAGLEFAGAVFTNITHDHLDFHGTFDNYIKAKKKIFDDLPKTAFALSNFDDKRGAVMLQNTKAKRQSFALKQPADFKGKVLDNTLQGLLIDFDGEQVWCKLTGMFNAYNLLGVYGVAILLGEEKERILPVLSALSAARGRFEQVMDAKERVGIVDYAHTPDALENVLQTIQDLRKPHQQIITIVGAGGNRDATKRPVMAEIACKYSDKVILTSDNPRNEDPMQILADMQKGVSITQRKKVLVIENRKEAIEKACELAQNEDIILLAGKGHETYQEIQGVKHDFDDKKILSELMNKN
ncbi:MAG: UDP-N-acetylmuramoyl-L-alanyl-D-glutamate--2,6-diaminopimelate ligase [Raineya sp.]|jgi:UDP-N-acetylmuramoyl-L-alanyl-D-glutamate--2,6-diaminopimelate ligase|nr:UDP-N-acetylmuramoyl-L-alanyl-D-glutamate--2,6-diaminopimelate ligase [Raineya sp.]